MDIYIHRNLLGFKFHHLVRKEEDGKIYKVKEIPKNALIVLGTKKLIELSKLYLIPLPSFPPKNYIKTFSSILKPEELIKVPWQFAIPSKIFKEYIISTFHQLYETWSKIDLSYYENHHIKTNELFDYLQPTKINQVAWKYHNNMIKELITPHVFKTFEPDENGFTTPTIYSRADTKTGRLKVISGANILHLPSEQRNILASRFGLNKGRIWSLDFSSLEPHVLYSLRNYFNDDSSKQQENKSNVILINDIYKYILEQIGNPSGINREIVKDIVLPQIYGAGYDTIVSKLSGLADPEGLINVINDIFNIQVIKNSLLKELEKNPNKYIKNIYGKLLDTSNIKPYMILNYWIQSIAVIISLYGFQKIIDKIKNNDQIIALFILHDALILDVNKEEESLLDELIEIGSIDIPLFENYKFPIKKSLFI